MKIEELIEQRKDQLDVESPPPEVWDGIRKEFGVSKKHGFEWWKVAAVIFFFLSIGLLIQNSFLKSEMDDLASLGDLSADYAQREKAYISQVAQLEEDIDLASLSDNSDYSWVFEELGLLEEINTMYRSDIGVASEEQLVEVLIDYYEKKIKLLKRLELEIERNSNKKNNETKNTDPISI